MNNHMNGNLSKSEKYCTNAADFVAAQWGKQPDILIITGSGLDYISEIITTELEIPYAEIPFFPKVTVSSHVGSLRLGRWNSKNIAVLRGRIHYYEGYSMAEVVRPVQTLARMGAKVLLVTSSVGCVTPVLAPGNLTLVRDHINLVNDNPLIGFNNNRLGPRFPDLLHAYSSKLMSKLQEKLKSEKNITLPETVLAFLSGPCFETEAELTWLKVIGADIVGWSLVPEVIAASHAGMEVLAFALVTDFSHPATVDKIDLDRIFQVGPAQMSEHLPIFETALNVIESAINENQTSRSVLRKSK